MKKTLVMLLSLTLVFAMCLVSGAVELDVAENAAEIAQVENATFEEVVVKPGINVLTGDTSLATFDTMPEAIFGSNDGIVKYEIVESEENNNILKWTVANIAGTGYPQMYINLSTEIGRKYYYKFDSKMTGTNAADKFCWLMYDSGNILANSYDAEYLQAMSKGIWATVEGVSNEADRATSQIGLQTKVMKTTADDPCCYYYDNMAIIPMYKITYTGVGVDHILLDEDGNVLTSFTPNPEMAPEWKDNDGKAVKFLGWSLLPDSDTPEESFELYNEDVVLYPVWETKMCLSSTWYMSGAVNTTFDITAAEAVEWTVDVGNSEATYTVSDTKLTIIAAGYPGVVKVTATTADGFVATKVIDVIGGGSYKPGLNMLTGTPDVLDFDNKPVGNLSSTPGQYNFYFSGVAGAAIVANPYADYTGNDGGNMLEMTFNQIANSYPSFIFRSPTEAGRPYEIKTKVATAYTADQFLWLNGDANMGYRDHLINSAQKKEWSSISKTFTGARSDLRWQFKSSANAKTVNHLDDLAVYPYYKITYIGLDGEVAHTEYVLYDVTGKFLTEYTPDISKLDGANKMSLTADGSEEVIGSITLAYEDITIYGIKTNDIIFMVNGEQKSIAATEDAYTIVAPTELGFESVENFLVWVDQSGNRYYEGDVIDSENMTGKTFTAFCQDATKPAMGFAYEGDKLVSNAAKYNYQEVMEDDGRSVLHAHQYGSTWNGTGYSTDPRIYLQVGSASAFDADEYNIVQYVAKMENGLRPVSGYTNTSPAEMPAEGLGVQEATQTIIFYYPESGTNSYWQNYGECRVGGGHDGVMDGVYRTIEVDMSILSNGNTNGGEWTNRKIYGFAIDANKWATFASDVYVDYIRVYRDGVFSVAYNTNAPTGATVVSEVSDDEGRGAGTGYLLKGEKPVVEGYTFVGWATKADATRADVVEAIDLTRDTTVYAVWQKNEAVKTPEGIGTELATKGTDTGIRFKTSIANVEKDVVDEIGFIGTLESLLPAEAGVVDYSALTFNFKSKSVSQKNAEDAKLYVTGVAYSKADDIDMIREETVDGLVYSAFCKGIPADKGDEKIVVKPYVQMNVNGNAITFYGETMVTTLNEQK